jgi:protease YdgD
MKIGRLSMRRRLLLALLHGLLIGAAAAAAQTEESPDLAKVDISDYPWSSIAKLNNSVGGSCTAVAIEQNAVLTAAHCIFNRRTNRFLLPGSLHVLLGYEQGKYAVHALVASYTIGPGYDPSRELATASSDWAVLQLVEPLPHQIRPLKFVDRIPAPGSQLMIGGYALRPLHIMTADMNCQLLGQVPGSPLIEHNCRVAQGSSGAPLLIMEGDSAVIMGLQVAVGRRNGAVIMVAVSAPSIVDNLRKLDDVVPRD